MRNKPNSTMKLLHYVFIFFPLFLVKTAHAVTCDITTTGLNFGSYNPLSTLSLNANGGITISCTNINKSVSGYLDLSPSSKKDTCSDVREMTAGGDDLNYDIYLDPGFLKKWCWDGNTGTGRATFTLTDKGAAPSQQSFMAYGRVPGAQTAVTARRYSDRISITLIYN